VEDDRRVVRLCVPEAVPVAEAERLAWEIDDVCRELEEGGGPVVCVALYGGEGFLFEPVDRSTWAPATAAAAAIGRSLGRLSPPTLAVLAGNAVGPAWEVALACDLRIAVADARLGSPALALGLLPGAGATQRLPRLAGLGTALRLLLLDEVLSGSEAVRLGLLHRAVPAAGLDDAVETLLDELRAAAPLALAFAKEAVRQAFDLPLAAGLRLEADLSTLLQTTDDRAEGLRAFAERRSARFEGR